MPANGEERCVICSEAITNPICLDCMEEGMEQWFATRNPSAIRDLKLWTRVFDAYTHKGVKCVVCGRNMNVCSHCYTEEMLDALEESIEDKESFVQAFRYNFSPEAT